MDALGDHEDRVLPRAVDVEVAHHRDRQPVGGVHREHQVLGHGLAGAIAPAGGLGGAEDPVVVLGPRRVGVLAEHFRGAGEHHPGAVPAAQLEHVAGAGDVDVEDPQRVVEVVLHADDGGQMEHGVDARTQGLFEGAEVGDVALHEPEVGVPVEVDAGVAGVLDRVDHRDRVPALQQRRHQVRSDQAVAARDDDVGHVRSFVWRVRAG